MKLYNQPRHKCQQKFFAIKYVFHCLIISSVVYCPAFCQQDLPETRLADVATVTKSYKDESRLNWNGTGKRTVRTTIWYPRNMHEKKILRKHKVFPLVIASHGAGGTALDMAWLGEFLSANGYIVAIADHKGDSSEEKNIGVLSLSDQNFWERPRDLKFILQKLLNDKFFKRYIDTSRIGAAGFSLGGYSVTALAGATVDMNVLRRNSMYFKDPDSIPAEVRNSIEQYLNLLQTDSILKNSLKHAEDNFKEQRVKAVVALSPAIGEAFTENGLKDIDVPVFIIVGDQDFIAPKETNALLYAKQIPGAQIKVLPGEVGHVTNPSDDQVRKNNATVKELILDFFSRLWGN